MAGSFWYCVKGYSRLQTVVAHSSAEAELFAIAEAAKEVAGLGQQPEENTPPKPAELTPSADSPHELAPS